MGNTSEATDAYPSGPHEISFCRVRVSPALAFSVVLFVHDLVLSSDISISVRLRGFFYIFFHMNIIDVPFKSIKFCLLVT